MNNNNKLRAFVRYNEYNKIVPGSLVVQRIKPKNGIWKEIDAVLCDKTLPKETFYLITEDNKILTSENNNLIEH